MTNHEKYMKFAIEQALVGKKEGEPPFGGIIIDRTGKIVAMAYDTVVRDNDLTSHSETNLVRQACKKVGPDLSGCTVYCTCEPCPMCFTALWLARIDTVVFGSYISDVLKMTNGKQRELNVPAESMNKQSGKKIKLIKEVLRDECIKLWDNYKK